MKFHQIIYGSSTIHFSLEYAERKTLGIKVHPDKSVQVIAPLDAQFEKITQKVKQKASWIIKQQDFFLSFHPVTPPRRFVSGETHLYLGKQYRLKIIESNKENVKLIGSYIRIQVKSKSNVQQIERSLKKWYTNKAHVHFSKLFEQKVNHTKTFYNGTPQLKFRWMDKRWGSCDKHGTIHLNTELIKAPKKCIEYVIIHEFCHLAHLNHSGAFYELLEELLPNWKATKNELERLMV